MKIRKVINKIIKKKRSLISLLKNFFNSSCDVQISSINYWELFKKKAKDVRELNIKNNFQKKYFIPLILAKFSHNITPETEPFIRYTFSMFFLRLVILVCFFNKKRLSRTFETASQIYGYIIIPTKAPCEILVCSRK